MVVNFFVISSGCDREIEVSLYFGGIEIMVIVLDVLSGKVK